MKMIAVKVYFDDGASKLGYIRECDDEESHFDVFFPFPCKVINWRTTPSQGGMAVNAYRHDVDYDQCEFFY